MKLRSIKAKLPKSIKRITILKSDDSSEGFRDADRVVVRKKRKKKKQSKGLIRIMERMARRSAKADKRTNSNYLSRHNRSNRKHRDGWLREFGYNMLRSKRKGAKSFKLSKLFE